MARDFGLQTGYILNTYTAKAADLVVVVLTSKGERLALIAKGVKKPTSRKAHAIDLLNKVNFKTESGVQLPVLTEIKLASDQSKLKASYQGLLTIQAVCELTLMLTDEGVTDTNLYQELDTFLETVSDKNRELLLATYLLHQLRFAGVLPDLGMDFVSGERLSTEEKVYVSSSIGFTNDPDSALEQIDATRIYKSMRFMQLSIYELVEKLNLGDAEVKEILKLALKWGQMVLERELKAFGLLLQSSL